MENKRAKCSIIIPSYNSVKTIEFTFKSLFNQSASDRIEEIIVVDSSDDELTRPMLHRYESENKVKHINSGIKIIPAIQRNIGAKVAIGDVLLFVDSDAFPENTWVEKILSFYDNGWMAGGGSYEVPVFQKENRVVLGQYYLEFSEFINTGKSRIKKLCPSCNLFVDKKLFIKVGGFPEIRASEDSLLGLKISSITKMIFIPEAIVYHIFRENEDHFYKNQVLLGKYIFIYRKMHYNSFYFKGVWPFFLFPLSMLFKFFRIYFRILFSDKRHLKDYNKGFLYFLKGMKQWGKGFYSGMYEDIKVVLNGS